MSIDRGSMSVSGQAISQASDLATLKKRRATIKASCTRIETFLNNVDTLTDDIRAQLEERRARLDIYWGDYERIQSRIETISEEEMADRPIFEEGFYTLCAGIRQQLQPAPSRPAARFSPTGSSVESSAESLSHVRLPKLNLPTFSGKYDEWFPFHDTFLAIIHNNASLSNVQRFQYLRASLNGEAINIIGSLEVSDRNYDLAWGLLRERYDNKRIIVQTHIKAILELPTMTRESAGELRQIADGVSRHVRALTALQTHADKWDDLLVHILSLKLDASTSREWHASLPGSTLPTLKQFTDFLAHRGQILEATHRGAVASLNRSAARSQSQSGVRRQALHATSAKGKCSYCSGEHLIYTCQEFLALQPNQRIMEMRKRRLCLNCLRSADHIANRCPSGNCRTCNLKHNTLLHVRRNSGETDGVNARGGGSVSAESSGVSDSRAAIGAHSAVGRSGADVLLSTAVVFVYDNSGSRRRCRALLDSGSQANFISGSLLKSLRLESRSVDVAISGIGGVSSTLTRAVRVRLRSRLSSFEVEMDCMVTDHIADNIPAVTMRRRAFRLPTGLELADPQFNTSSSVDLLIGADLFWQLLCVGQVKATVDHPTLQKTRLGWVLAGRVCSVSCSGSELRALRVSVSDADLHRQVSRFWDLEELAGESGGYTREEQACETHFINNHVSTDAQGRYTVKLPIKEEVLRRVGDSREIAMRRFCSLERRLNRDLRLKSLYTQFMREYLTLGHMRLAAARDAGEKTVYLPHHGILRGSNGDVKLRVVFDASCKTSTGISLNDALMTGPTVQQDLVSILMRFRTFGYVFAADIVKMYRQVLVHDSQTRLQRVLWRDDSSSPVRTYELLTVTYGTRSAPFLATRAIKDLAQRWASKYPAGARCALRDFYVDDLLTGANSLAEARRIRDEVVGLLARGQFELGKWSSNCRELLPCDAGSSRRVPLTGESESKILGIMWDPCGDEFRFVYDCSLPAGRVTKRTMLSEIASLFDPLGLLGPMTVVAKLVLQDTWRARIGWDESLPQDIHERWSRLKRQLGHLNELRVPRWVGCGGDVRRVQLHGFCDASERTYGACVYVRTELAQGRCRIELLSSKSRVAPVRAVSLPRLELSAALLLARLIEKVGSSIELTGSERFLWSDSTIVLQWISSSSRKWTAFVANRVGEIQRLTGGSSWRHVPSSDNPADILSRGSLSDLCQSSKWWNGPSFLQSGVEGWPNGRFVDLPVELPERRKVVVTVSAVGRSMVGDLLSKHSDLDKILRIIAYCLRFIYPRRARPRDVFVSHQEMTTALRILTRGVQREAFPEEYRLLSEGRSIGVSSRILSLTPFIDGDGVIRVGGRLSNSALPYEMRHPMLLPKGHILTCLVVRKEHIKNLHSGLQVTIHAVRRRFWPLAARSVARKIIHGCMTCFKCRPVSSEALMADLPKNRVTISRPFNHTGVDYAGPILLKEGRRRNARMRKAYISIFICFTTKAVVHMEIVSDLTSEAFLGAFKRFISRRGKPVCMYSDNGTAFVGAQRQLREFFELINNDSSQSAMRELLRSNEISWNFLPPHAPHFGGLWEAAVKSAKYHIQRVVGNANLSLEEMQTVLCEIEAILNSRPLTPLSADPNDLACITPSHFLIGTALNSFPVPDLTDEREGRLLRWQRVEQMRQHFWRRWTSEYLHTLIERQKWRISKSNQLKIGRLVLIQQPGLGPLQWVLGRVQQVHPGADGVVRAATLKTSKGCLTRPLTRLAILPLDGDDSA